MKTNPAATFNKAAFLPAMLAFMLFGAVLPASAAEGEVPRFEPTGKYQFDGTISRQVLENFLARSISVEGVFNGRGDLDDNLRMLKPSA